ncbi:hypothetical protein ACFL35_13480 [Candidatus Riflebacteria bacterium]
MEVRKQVILGYAMGGGAGHLHRMVALFRAFRKEYEPIIFTNCKHAFLYAKEGIKIHSYPRNSYVNQARLFNWLLSFSHYWIKACMVFVDSFAFGILGELERYSELNCTGNWIFLSRIGNFPASENCPPYVLQINLERDSRPIVCQKQYFLQNPILIRNFDEILSRKKALARLRLKANKKNILFAHSGPDSEVAQLHEKLQAAVFDNSAKIQIFQSQLTAKNKNGLFPLLTYFSAFAGFYGAVGYNFYSETRQLQRRAFLSPQKRQFDLQEQRCKNHFPDLNAFIEAIRKKPAPAIKYYENGAMEIFQLIEKDFKP